MPSVHQYVHDENTRNLRKKLATETDPQEIQRLKSMIRQEDEIYEEAQRTPESVDPTLKRTNQQSR